MASPAARATRSTNIWASPRPNVHSSFPATVIDHRPLRTKERELYIPRGTETVALKALRAAYPDSNILEFALKDSKPVIGDESFTTCRTYIALPRGEHESYTAVGQKRAWTTFDIKDDGCYSGQARSIYELVFSAGKFYPTSSDETDRIQMLKIGPEFHESHPTGIFGMPRSDILRADNVTICTD
jgi:hypothetical protein